MEMTAIIYDINANWAETWFEIKQLSSNEIK